MDMIRLGDKVFLIAWTGPGRYICDKKAKKPILRKSGAKVDSTTHHIRVFKTKPEVLDR